MNIGLFLVVLAMGAAAVALWCDFRLRRFAPGDLRRTLLHILASMVVGQLLVPPLMKVVLAGDSEFFILLAIFGIGFPALTYCLLTAIWTIRAAQGAVRH